MKPALSILAATTLIVPAFGEILITEAMSNSAHSDGSADGDWFEITNTGDSAVEMEDYSFDDKDSIPGASGGFPAYLLPAGASMIILDNPNSTKFRTLWNLETGIRIVTSSEISNFQGLGKNGDSVVLFDKGGTLVDDIAFGAATTGRSFARFRNGDLIPGGKSTDGLFGAYSSDDSSEDVGSPGIASNLPEPLAPIFSGSDSTVWIAGRALVTSEFRIQAADPNPNDTITITAGTTPSWLSVVDMEDGTARFSGTPPINVAGEFEIPLTARDDTDRSTDATYTLTILPASSPIIVNEYNAVDADEFLGGGDQDTMDGAEDTTLGRVAGNGGAWVEFFVTATENDITSTLDIRGWTLRIESDEQTRILKFADHPALAAIPQGTLLTMTEDRETSPTAFHRVSNITNGGYSWTNIWMHDPILIEQDESTHPQSPAISSSNTRFTFLNSSDVIVYGPSGESIAVKDGNMNEVGDELVGVGGTETFSLQAAPSSSRTPIDLNYDDSSNSSFGAPNEWSNGTQSQNLNVFRGPFSPPAFGLVSQRKAARGSYSAEILASPGVTLENLNVPDFLMVSQNSNSITITNSRPLTAADVGRYEVTVQSTSENAHHEKGFLVYELEVLNPSPSVILNEYNAVESDKYLNGGTLLSDTDGSPASSDSHFGRVLGNGGNWFELAVVGDGNAGTTDLKDWVIEIGKTGIDGEFAARSTIKLTNASTFSNVSNGTILTFIEKNSVAGGLDTQVNRVNQLTTTGYAWSNFHLESADQITVTDLESFATGSSGTQFVIKDSDGFVVFGPAGEGVAPADGIGSEEVFELQADPSPQVSPIDEANLTSSGFDDGSSGSTFGAPNIFAPPGTGMSDRAQDFSPFVSASNLFEEYLAGLGLSGAGAGDDSDGDGYSNLEEYLLGGAANDARNQPVIGYNESSKTTTISVRTNDPAYEPIAQRSGDLKTWVTDSLNVIRSESALGNNFEKLSISYSEDAPRMFFRIAFEIQN